MDPTLLGRVQKAASQVVRHATSSGALERGELTQAVARREIAKRLSLDPDELDRWKQEVKREVERALVSSGVLTRSLSHPPRSRHGCDTGDTAINTMRAWGCLGD